MGVILILGVRLILGVGDDVVLGVIVGVDDTVAVMVGVGVRLMLAVKLTLAVGVGVVVGVNPGVPEMVADGVGVFETVGVGVGVSVTPGVLVGLGLGVATGGQAPKSVSHAINPIVLHRGLKPSNASEKSSQAVMVTLSSYGMWT